jgi:hypothetical protein
MMGDAGDGLMVIVDKGSFSILRYRGRIPGFGLWSVHISICLQEPWARPAQREEGEQNNETGKQSGRQARRDICAVRYFQSQFVNSLCNFVGINRSTQIRIHTIPCHAMPALPPCVVFTESKRYRANNPSGGMKQRKQKQRSRKKQKKSEQRMSKEDNELLTERQDASFPLFPLPRPLAYAILLILDDDEDKKGISNPSNHCAGMCVGMLVSLSFVRCWMHGFFCAETFVGNL